MKSYILVSTFLLAIATAICALNAQSLTALQELAGFPDSEPGDFHPGPDHPPHPLLEHFDTNRDGTISAEEIEAAAQVLKTLDENSDGAIGQEELPPPPPPHHDHMRPRRGGPGEEFGDRGPGKRGRGKRGRRGKGPQGPPPRDARTGEDGGPPPHSPRCDPSVDGGPQSDISYGRRAPMPPHPPEGRPPHPLLVHFDTDQDGQVSSAEIEAASQILKTLDLNQDGAISDDELPGPPPPPHHHGHGHRDHDHTHRGPGNPAEPHDRQPPPRD